MEKSELFPLLSDIIFAERDPTQILSNMTTIYESLTGQHLTRSSPVRLFLDAITLILIQQRNEIDITGKRNLLAYSDGEYLEHKGALVGVRRLPASHAVCTVRFTLTSVRGAAVVVPSGVRVTPDGRVMFELTAPVVIPAGELSGEGLCMCQTGGAAGNGYLPGQVSRLVDVQAYELAAANVDETSGGADTESDENLRERIQLAPESFSTAGSIKGYEYYTRSADSDIISVSVLTPPDTQPGNVDIYVLMTGGVLPSTEVMARVLETCNGLTTRPDTDYVHVKQPVVVPFSVNVRYWVDSSQSVSVVAIEGAVDAAVQSWVKWQRGALGRDINPSRLIHAMVQAGAKRVDVTSPVFRVLQPYEVAQPGNVTVTYCGLEEV